MFLFIIQVFVHLLSLVVRRKMAKKSRNLALIGLLRSRKIVCAE
jgi:hypothetical protein